MSKGGFVFHLNRTGLEGFNGRARRVAVRVVAVALLGISALAGTASCGVGSDEDACRHFFEVFCEREATCNPHYFSIIDFEDPSTCTERLSLACADRVALPNTNFHAAATSACADALSQLSCEQWEGPDPPACDAALRGTLQGNDPCVDRFQCSSGICIVPANSTAYFTCGRCAPLVEAGAPCNKESVCDTGFHCAGKVCTAFKQLGDACENLADCDLGLTCLTGTCAPPRALGDLCSNDGECNQEDAQYCDSSTETCTVFPTSYWRGACFKAVFSGQPEVALCRAGFFCEIDPAGTGGHCEPTLPDGATCAGAIVDPCTMPARCTAGICTLPEVPMCTAP